MFVEKMSVGTGLSYFLEHEQKKICISPFVYKGKTPEKVS